MVQLQLYEIKGKKIHRKIQGVPQSQAVANPWHQEEEKTRAK